MKRSLERQLAALLLGWLLVAAAAGALLTRLSGSVLLATVVCVGVGLLPSLWLARRAIHPVRKLLRALSGTVASYREGDFSLTLVVDRYDELGELLTAHNQLGHALREQHTQLVQRELLLETITQNSPLALVLVDAHQRVAYANTAAGQLLSEGRSISGQNFNTVLQRAPQPFGAVADAGNDDLFSGEIDGEEETFHLAKRSFRLQGRMHHLYLFKRLTRELSRQEVATWKKLIRVLSHELNNTLAPIASLAQSGVDMARRRQTPELGDVFNTIGERAEHLHQFIMGYAQLAKLPTPRLEPVEWRDLIGEVVAQQACRVTGSLPPKPGCFDRAQIAQALINLVKNAHEAGGPVESVELTIDQNGAEHRIQVSDRGPGMRANVMSQALLPFYSTKRSGTGLGLALVREIAEAHGGHIQLSNRDGGGLCATLALPATPTMIAPPFAAPEQTSQ